MTALGRTPAPNPADLDRRQARTLAPHPPEGDQGKPDAFKVLIKCSLIPKCTFTERFLRATGTLKSPHSRALMKCALMKGSHRFNDPLDKCSERKIIVESSNLVVSAVTRDLKNR